MTEYDRNRRSRSFEASRRSMRALPYDLTLAGNGLRPSTSGAKLRSISPCCSRSKRTAAGSKSSATARMNQRGTSSSLAPSKGRRWRTGPGSASTLLRAPSAFGTVHLERGERPGLVRPLGNQFDSRFAPQSNKSHRGTGSPFSGRLLNAVNHDVRLDLGANARGGNLPVDGIADMSLSQGTRMRRSR
jgi:hypothetical protein